MGNFDFIPNDDTHGDVRRLLEDAEKHLEPAPLLSLLRVRQAWELFLPWTSKPTTG